MIQFSILPILIDFSSPSYQSHDSGHFSKSQKKTLENFFLQKCSKMAWLTSFSRVFQSKLFFNGKYKWKSYPVMYIYSCVLIKFQRWHKIISWRYLPFWYRSQKRHTVLIILVREKESRWTCRTQWCESKWWNISRNSKSKIIWCKWISTICWYIVQVHFCCL